MSEETQDIQWHSPFRGAVKIELEPYKNILEYIDEKLLTKKPLQIDLLVIKKPSDVTIENPIGKIFRGINIMEYKSPTDYVSIDDFYKVSAYAYLLKSDADTEDAVKFEDMTISLVSSKVRRLVFEHLKNNRGYEVTKQADGIYYLRKEKEIPAQCLILEELGSIHKWLVALTDDITVEKLHNIAADYDPAEKNEYKQSVMETVIKANYEFIKSLKEDEAMSKEVLELFRPEIEAEVDRRVQDVDRKIQEMVVKLYRLNLPMSQIVQVTELPEEEVLKIINE
jgi:hypothetical protein